MTTTNAGQVQLDLGDLREAVCYFAYLAYEYELRAGSIREGVSPGDIEHAKAIDEPANTDRVLRGIIADLLKHRHQRWLLAARSRIAMVVDPLHALLDGLNGARPDGAQVGEAQRIASMFLLPEPSAAMIQEIVDETRLERGTKRGLKDIIYEKLGQLCEAGGPRTLQNVKRTLLSGGGASKHAAAAIDDIPKAFTGPVLNYVSQLLNDGGLRAE